MIPVYAAFISLAERSIDIATAVAVAALELLNSSMLLVSDAKFVVNETNVIASTSPAAARELIPLIKPKRVASNNISSVSMAVFYLLVKALPCLTSSASVV